MVHLRPTCDAGSRSLTQRVLGDVVAKPRENAGALRSRADNVHLAPNHVDKLRNLIDAVFAHHAADPCNPAIPLDRPYGSVFFRTHPHGPELQNHEWSATEVACAPIIWASFEIAPTIKSYAGLRVKDWSVRCDLNESRENEQYG